MAKRGVAQSEADPTDEALVRAAVFEILDQMRSESPHVVRASSVADLAARLVDEEFHEFEPDDLAPFVGDWWLERGFGGYLAWPG